MQTNRVEVDHVRICFKVVHLRLMKEQFDINLQLNTSFTNFLQKIDFVLRIHDKFTHFSNIMQFFKILIFFDKNTRENDAMA